MWNGFIKTECPEWNKVFLDSNASITSIFPKPLRRSHRCHARMKAFISVDISRSIDQVKCTCSSNSYRSTDENPPTGLQTPLEGSPAVYQSTELQVEQFYRCVFLYFEVHKLRRIAHSCQVTAKSYQISTRHEQGALARGTLQLRTNH